MKRLLKALVGLSGLAVLLVGVPIVLWNVGKAFWPDHAPSLGEAWSRLTQQDNGQLFLGAIVVIGVIAWLFMVVGFVLEVPSAFARRRRNRSVRGLGWAQRTASVLLLLVITGSASGLLAGTASASPTPPPLPQITAVARYVPPVTAPTPAASSTSKAVQRTHTTDAPAAALPIYTVRQGDTLWSIAEDTLGDGARSPEILALNEGQPQPGGGALTATNYPKVGWRLRLPADASLTRQAPVASHHPTATPTSVSVHVRPGDTLSEIAQQQLGTADLYPQLAKANHLTNPDDLDVGQTITIPSSLIQQVDHEGPAAGNSATTRTVRVQPGDTLMAIAQREMGNPALFSKLAQVNHIANPNDIVAGSSIVIPATQPHTPPTAGRHGHPTTTAPSAPHTSTPTNSGAPPSTTVTKSHNGSADPTAPTTMPAPAPTSAPAVAMPSTPAVSTPAPVTKTQLPAQTGTPQPTSEQAPGAAAATPPAAAPTTPAATTSAHSSEVAPAPDSSQVSSVAALLGITAVAAGAVWCGLVLARRRSHCGRRPGRQSAPPSLLQVRAEKTLRERAAEVDVAWLDMALRSLGTVLAGAEDQMPDILGATLSPAGLRLQLSTPAPAPEPFSADGAAWLLSAGAELPITGSNAVDQLAPLPTLTSIGSRGEETVFVDLERLGAINLIGDPDACRGLLTHVATELAHQSWSDGLNVTLVGWGQRLVALNSERLAYAATTDGVLRALQTRVSAVPEALGVLGTDVLRARAGDIAGDSWTPQVLLIDASNIPAEDLVQLQARFVELAGAGRIATAVLMTGAAGPSTAEITTVEVAAAGALRMPRILGEGSITAACLTEADVDLVIDLFDVAEQVDHPIPVSAVDEPWAADMDSSGALVPPVAMEEPVDLLEAQNRPLDEGDDPDPVPHPAPATHRPDRDRLAEVMNADPTLNDDLAEWRQETPRRPRVAILGTAEVTASGEIPKRLAWFTEVSVYLALHRGGVSLDKFTADLWPAEGRPGKARQIARSTRNETVSKIRRWLGTDPATGDLYVPLSTDGTYKLEDRLLDVELMQRLRKRGDARVKAGDRSAIDDYEAALKLVRGRPLPESTRVLPTVPRIGTGWGWLCNENRGEDLLMPGWVVDVAHRAVQAALSLNDLEKARWAANLGHEVDPYSDVPLTDLMIIAAAAGDMATANRHAWEVVWAYEKDNAEALPEHTYSIISRVFPDGLLAVSR